MNQGRGIARVPGIVTWALRDGPGSLKSRRRGSRDLGDPEISGHPRGANATLFALRAVLRVGTQLGMHSLELAWGVTRKLRQIRAWILELYASKGIDSSDSERSYGLSMLG